MLKEITMFEFNDFVKNHNLANLYQTSNYAIFKGEENFDYEYLGYFENDSLIAASLILYKTIAFNTKYAYAPCGYIMDFENEILLKNFSLKLKRYLRKKRIIFLKLNPLIITKQYDPWTLKPTFIEDINYTHIFQELGYKKLKDNLYFEATLPRFEAIIDLKNFDLKNIKKNTRNKINNSLHKGLELIKGDEKDLKTIYDFIKYKKNKNYKYYNNLYKAFNADNSIDLFLVKIDYEKFMESANARYEEEQELNSRFNEELKKYSSERNLNKKILSDKLLVTYKNDVIKASNKITNNELEEYIAGALVIKNNKNVSILFSGYKPSARYLNANYFLHYALIQYYKNNYNYLGLNGLTGDFTDNNPYKGLNEFKLGFKPQVLEYLGELDFIIDEKKYNMLLSTGKLHNFFDKK